MSGLNANAVGFVPFGGASSSAGAESTASASPSSKLQQPEKPSANATPEEIAAWKTKMVEYLAHVKAEKARLEQENVVRQQQQQQKPKFEVETVYAEDVGYDDEDDGYFDDFVDGQQDDYDVGTNGTGEDFDDDDAANDEPPLPASQYLGKELDANELFRIAKTARSNPSAMADFFGVEAELVARAGFSLSSLRDSYNRSVVHFAAEGGLAELVEELRKKLGDAAACAADDKGLAPWQVAVLCRRPACAKLLVPPGGIQGMRGPDDLEDEACFSMLLQNFTPKTAAPVLAFGAKPPAFSETHKVWGSSAFQPNPELIRTQSISCASLDPHDVSTLEPFDLVCSSFGNKKMQAGGLAPQMWAQPRTALEFATRQKFTHLVAAFQAQSNEFIGACVFSAIGMLAGPKVPPPLLGQDAYCVAHAAVKDTTSVGGGGAIMHHLMKQCHADYQGTTVFLRTAAKLPVGNPVAQVKWMYRIVRPWNVFVENSSSNSSNSIGGPAGVSTRSSLAKSGGKQQETTTSTSAVCPLRQMICPDYLKYASTSMIDTITRQAIGENFPVPKSEVATWEVLDCRTGVSDSDADQIADVVNRVVNGESAFGVHWNGLIVKVIMEAEDLVMCVKRGGANGGVSDVILYRTLNPLQSPTMAVGILTGAFCPTLPKGRRAVVCAALAALRVEVDVLFTTNTFGMANADLVNAFFDDLPGSIEKVYCLAGVDKASPLPAAMTASSVYVPFF